ncbi:MAG: aldehyde dehydrogenase family protein [Bacteroidales bacterium]|nr:aldehyde dehydrogenase family protein [Bacteroidales bacterium]
MTNKFENNIQAVLTELGIEKINDGTSTGTRWIESNGDLLDSFSPGSGECIASIKQSSWDNYEYVIEKAQQAFKTWKMVPAPKRGEIVRQIGDEFRKHKESLANLISIEMGKTYQESLGEVQEAIDIADFALGQSRQLYGYTMHSERFKHRMYEQYHPMGIVGVISAFNFPVAVWAWNTMLALIAGDVVIWKPSSSTFLSAIATQKIVETVLKRNNIEEGVVNLTAGGSKYIGDEFLKDKRVPLISCTASTAVGRKVGRLVGERLGKALLELGGNNAIIVSPSTDLEMAVRATLFGAVGTTGQRCTSTRRVFIQEGIYNEFIEKLVNAYKQIRIGHPGDPEVLVGPMVNTRAVEAFKNALSEVQKEGGKLIYGGEILQGKGYESGCFVVPAIAEAENHYHIVQEETFAPLLYIMKYKELDEAIEMQNNVPQGLSSALFSRNMLETEQFLSHEGSDCGIANINIGTSGAEIGGAFGGEKDTGGGRESGSDSWKFYMRRQTNTINYGTELPLAQGINFIL